MSMSDKNGIGDAYDLSGGDSIWRNMFHDDGLLKNQKGEFSMKKMIACLLLVTLVLPVTALADVSFDFVIEKSVFNKYVYSSQVKNTDSVEYAGVAPNATNLQGDDSVAFAVVNTSNSAISDSVTFRNSSVTGKGRLMYYDTSKTYSNVYVKLRGKFSPRDYQAYIRGVWAP